MDEQEHEEGGIKRLWLTVTAGVLLGIGLFSFFTGVLADFTSGFYALSLTFVTAPVLYHAAKRFHEYPFNEDLLMGVVGISAAAIGVWAEGAAVLLLFNIAERVEDYTVDRVSDITKRVAGLIPKRALLKKKDGRLDEVSVDTLSPGDTIVVKAGWRIPVDGKITAGRSTIDQSAITGESIPVEKSVGDGIFSGSLSVDGSVEVLVEKPYKESMVSRIVEMVTEAQENKAKIERFIDKFSRYYTPSMIIASASIALVPPLAFGQPFNTWLYRALIVLVIACPSALVISTPVTVLMGLTRAMWSGILVKGGKYLEELTKIKIVIFDKTGTLTKGQLKVARVVPLNGFAEDEVLRVAAAAESKSSHPIARAIVERSSLTNNGDLSGIIELAEISGKGLKATLSSGSTIHVGRISYLKEVGVEIGDETLLRSIPSSGTTVAVAMSKRIVGLVCVEDEIRPEAKGVVSELRSMGVKVAMLTGDNSATGRDVSKAVGIDDCYAELLPEDKVRIAKDLKTKYGETAMVGDGINDAPALAASNVGMAMGTAGNDVALEAADVALMGSNLKTVPYLLKLGRKVSSKIRVNIALALGLKAFLIILGAMGLIPLWFAVVGDDGLTLVIIANALPLLRFRP